MSFRIVSDLGADIPLNLMDTNQLYVINQPVTLNDEEKIFEHGNAKDMQSFYNQLANAKTFRTRAMTYEELYKGIAPHAQSGDVLCFSFSARLSATGGQMQKVCNDLDGKPHNVKYFDTQTASLGQGIIVYLAIQCRNNGMSIEQTVDYLTKAMQRLRCYVLLDKDNNFFKGGRADGVAQKSSLYPLLYLPLGDLFKQVATFLTPQMALNFLRKKLTAQPLEMLFVGHGNNVAQAQQIVEEFGHGITSGCAYTNAVMGIHSGKDPIFVAYLTK